MACLFISAVKRTCESTSADRDPVRSYVDNYVSTLPGSNATLVGKSIVVHSYNTTRLTCANFVAVNGSTPSISNVTTATSTPSAVPFTGSAATKVVGFGAMAAGVLAFFL